MNRRQKLTTSRRPFLKGGGFTWNKKKSLKQFIYCIYMDIDFFFLTSNAIFNFLNSSSFESNLIRHQINESKSTTKKKKKHYFLRGDPLVDFAGDGEPETTDGLTGDPLPLGDGLLACC
jgi:hypothetical protein